LINVVHVGYAMHMLFVNVYLDLTSVRACLCSVFFIMCPVCEFLYFILILPKGE